MFFGSSATARISPSAASASLIVLAIVLAVVQSAAGSWRISVNRPLGSITCAGMSASITAPPLTTPTVGVLGSSICTGALGHREDAAVGDGAGHRGDEQPAALEALGGALAHDVDVEWSPSRTPLPGTLALSSTRATLSTLPSSLTVVGSAKLREHPRQGLDGRQVVPAVAGPFEPDDQAEAGQDVGPLAAEARDVGDLDGARAARARPARASATNRMTLFRMKGSALEWNHCRLGDSLRC